MDLNILIALGIIVSVFNLEILFSLLLKYLEERKKDNN